MAEQQVFVPDIGDAEDVDVVEVLVGSGARVEPEQSLIVLESDKASMEIPSPAAGVVKTIALSVGDKVSQGTLILTLDADGTGAAQSEAASAAHDAPEQDAPQPPAPHGGVSGAVAPGPKSPAAGAGAQRTIPPLAGPPRSSRPPPQQGFLPHATPSVRRLARELGVDLGHVRGTGRKGRILRQDVQAYIKHAMAAAGTQTGTGFAFPELPAIDFSKFGDTTVQPLTKIQKVSGRNLHRSWVTIPHVTQFDSADITELEAFRKKMRADRPDVKLTLLSFFMKAVVVVLKEMPRFNASLDASGEHLIFKHYYHVGVAVDTENGLVVPVIRDVDIKGLTELAEELRVVSERARARKLSPSDMQGGCFTISSLGGIGGTAFTPIINPPEVAVLGVSRAAHEAVYVDGKFEPRLTCPLSLSYDHRVIDGADAARFTTALRRVLGDIRQMLL
ncbi:MAG: dihydrolipoyllysine-residue acetyltransferase [Myxococcales bacterium]|nr:dihydrolipoyllysine-residue acetyltransferase [Myxococcales bacterium]